MDPRLLLYIEEDYVLPLSFDREGRYHEFAKDDDNRLWLYFYSSEHSVDFSRTYSPQCVSETYGYYGNFLQKQADMTSRAVVNGREVPYFDLMKLSSMLRDIREFYKQSTGDSSAKIPVSYIFAESLDTEVRKVFMQNMSAEDFSPVSFSTFPSSIIVDYAVKALPREWKFGDNIMIIFSSADMFRLTTVVYDGSTWHADGGCKVIHEVGDAPLKEAFIKYVVDEVDKNRSHLVTAEARRREYLHQRPNADRWLSLKRDSRGNFDIDDYSYYINPSIKYSCHVEGGFLTTVYEQAVRTTVGMIEAYRREVIGDNLALTVFCGPAFDDEELVRMIKSSLGNPAVVSIPGYQMPKALKCFWPDYMNETEDLSRYNSIVSHQLSARKSISSWIASAAKIRHLWEKFTEYIPVLKHEVEGDQFHYDEMVRLCQERLRVSDFDGAKAKLLVYDIPSEQTRAAKFTVDALLNEKEDLQQIFASVKSIAGARQVIGEIDRYSEIASQLHSDMKAQSDGLQALRECIVFYESNYDAYLELKRRLQSVRNMSQAKELVKEMSRLTLEPLPEIELEHVDVQLEGKYVVTKTGFLGLKKKVELVYGMKVKMKRALPCNAVINISNSVQIQANEGDSGCVAVTLAKGETSYEGVLPLPDTRIDTGKPLYIYIFPEFGVLDNEAINAEYIIVKKLQ